MNFDDAIFGNPKYDEEKCFVCEGAVLVGDITLENDVMIAPNAVIRADECGPFRIGKGTNVQDLVLIHGLFEKRFEVNGKQYSVYIGSHCSIAHESIVHGPAVIGKKTFVGFKAIVHASRVGRNCYIDFGAKVKNAIVGNNCYIGMDAKVKNVTIPDGRYVEDGKVVKYQEEANLLPVVPEEIRAEANEFNKEVVDTNKKLRELHKERQVAQQKAAA